MTVRLSYLAAAVCLAASAAFGDHIPGHDNDDPTFPVPLPGPDFFNGGILFGTFIGPVEGTEITSTVFDITWVSDGETPASELLIEIEVMVDDKIRELSVSGADLGFGEGPGTFHGRLTTDYFNGVVWQPKVFQHSLIDLALGATTGGIDGFAYFEKSFITFNVIPAGANSADLNNDGIVGPADLAQLLASWGHCVGCPADLNHDNAVGPADLAALLAAWG